MSATTSPLVRHRRRMLAWVTLALAAIIVLIITAGTASPSIDGRHLLAIVALAGLVLEAERGSA